MTKTLTRGAQACIILFAPQTGVPFARGCGPVVQLVRMPPCHGGDHGFKSHSGRHFFGWFSFFLRRHSQVVRPRTANPLSPVRLWVSPPNCISGRLRGLPREAFGSPGALRGGGSFRRHSQVVRPRTANPLSPVRLWVSPPENQSRSRSPGFLLFVWNFYRKE